MITYTILGSVPSKKNSRNLFVRNGRIVNIPQKAYGEWHTDSLKQLKMPPKPLQTVKYVQLCFYSKDKRAYDLTNKAESVMDLLVDAGILLDDNYTVVPELTITYGGLCRENPRCEITIYEY